MGAALGKQTTPGKTHERMKIFRRTDGSTASTRPPYRSTLSTRKSGRRCRPAGRQCRPVGLGMQKSGMNGSTVSTRWCGLVDVVDPRVDIVDPLVWAGRPDGMSGSTLSTPGQG